jgi:Protein of unknown function (DUF3485)
MARYIPAGAALVLIVVSALLQGRASERWEKFPELQLYADQLINVPLEIGDWRAREHEEPSKRVLEAAGAVGNLSRDYTNEKGQTVSMFLVTGRVQDMFYHEPKRCYKASGFEMQEDPQRFEFAVGGEGETANFFASRFVKTDETGRQEQMVYWSWNGSGEWLAPREYKWDFRGQHAIYKVYLMYVPGSGDTVSQNPVTDFIPQLIPELDKALSKATIEGRPTDEN